MNAHRTARTVSLLLVAAVQGAAAQAQTPSEVYERFADAVVKVEVVERNSDAPTSVGTAFFVTPNLVATNYHVVRDLLFEEDVYRPRLLDHEGAEVPFVALVALDVANDLALLRVDADLDRPLQLIDEPVPNGEVLYSMGHPRDLSTAVVEGVYNGLVEAAIAPRMHFSGSINPGMSGGPTVRADGTVVGVNVATAGNQVSFLIPADRVAAVLTDAMSADVPTREALLDDANERLTAFQNDFFGATLGGDFATLDLGRATLPAPPEGLLQCEAIPYDIEDDRYELTEYACAAEDGMLLGSVGSYDLVYLEHMWMSAGSLTTFAFHALLNEWYTTIFGWEAPANEDATEYSCRERNVADGLDAELVATVCLRRLDTHSELYDLFVRSVLMGGEGEGVVSTLRAAPIAFEHVTGLTEGWLRGFSWSN
ncbi:MAG: serine protease [Gemmatimonadota bacterium]